MESESEVKHSICMWCNSRCRLRVHVKDNRLVEAEEDPDYPVKIHPPATACLRRMAAREWFYHPDRLKYPLKRIGERGAGQWRQVTWDEALDEIAQRLAYLRQQHGAETLASLKGTLRTSDEYRTRFLNLFGTPNNLGHSQICFGPRSVISKCIVGWFPYPHLSPDAHCVLFLGREPSQSWPRIWKVVRDLKEQAKTKFICVDPRRSASSELADLWLRIRPGTDCALLLSMVNVIISEGLYDKGFVERWCLGFDQLKERVAEYTTERASEITWLPEEQIVAAARMYATNRPAAICEGMGLEHSTNSEVLQARYILSAIMGNIDVPGGDRLFGPHPRFISDREIEMEEALSKEQRDKQIGAETFRLYSFAASDLIQPHQQRVWGKGGGVLNSDNQAHGPLAFRAMITGEPYPIRALITLASNPMLKLPNTKLVYKALKALDLHVVVDFWMTPTAELADYVLPAASWLERPYILSGENTFNWIVAGERALPSSIEGEYDRRTDFQFWRQLGVRLGQKEYWPWETDEEAYSYRLGPLGCSFDEFLRRGGSDFPPAEYRSFEKKGFATPSGKIELHSSILERLGYDPLPRFVEPEESPIRQPDLARDYPFILINGGRFKPMYHSEHRQVDSLRKMHPAPLVQVHPETARSLGIADGDWVWIETPRGTITQKCQYFEGIDPRVVHAEHGWWFPEKPGEEPWLHGVWESNINVCTDDEPAHCNQMIGAWPARTGLCRIRKRKVYAPERQMEGDIGEPP